MTKTILCYGEILWDLHPSGPILGGAPLNFAYRMQELGNQAFPVSRLGNDPLGIRAAEQMADMGLPMDFVQSIDVKPTGSVPVTLAADGQAQYIITPDVAYDHIGLSEGLLLAATSVDCIYFGTLAQRGEASRHTLHAMLDAAPPSVLKVCDVNLRKDCYTRAIILDSLRRADVVKLSLEEIAPIGEAMGSTQQVAPDAFAAKLIEQFTLRSCVITRGGDGVFAADEQGEKVDVPGYKVQVADTIGAGDAFFAGFTDASLKGAGLEAACRAGNVLGALAAQKRGGTAAISPQEIAELSKA